MMNRRELMKRIALGTAAANFPGLVFADADTSARFVLIILRGAVDGLALVAPYGDSQYRNVRGELALPSPGVNGGVLKLDSLFGLHPALASTHALFAAGELLPIHAIASPYRERSHFDGQDMLEKGVGPAGVRRDGWLNRALAETGADRGRESAIALSQNLPLVLRGENGVASWAPSQLPDANDDTLRRIEMMYEGDAFFSERLAQALDAQKIADDMSTMNQRGRRNGREQSTALMQAAGKFLVAEDGPRIAVLESGGWDTHANQGRENGILANKFADLDEDLATLRQALLPVWSKTIVTVVTEFGRTVSVNGTRGTDHGTATAALMLGGAVRGGKVVTDWPGLANGNLYQGRDLFPTTDTRSVFKAILTEHLQLAEGFVERYVFPESGKVQALTGLVRA